MSTDALLNDEEARAQFEERIDRKGGSAADVPARISSVVLGLARKGKPLTSANLFTFTQVTMVRLVDVLQRQRVDVYIEPIPRAA